MKILDGKKLNKKIADDLERRILSFAERGLPKPHLVIIQIGHVKASDIYISYKLKFAEKIGAIAEVKNFSNDVATDKIISEIKKLNENSAVHGIIVQLPVPPAVDLQKILNSISPHKDVDGMSAENIYKLSRGENKGATGGKNKGVTGGKNEDVTGGKN